MNLTILLQIWIVLLSQTKTLENIMFVFNICYVRFCFEHSFFLYMFKKESSVISWLEYVENKFNKRHCSFCFSLYFFLFTLTFSFLIRWFVIGLLLILWYLLLILSCFIREWLTQFKSFLNHFFPDLILNVLYESAAIYDIDRWKKIG